MTAKGVKSWAQFQKPVLELQGANLEFGVFHGFPSVLDLNKCDNGEEVKIIKQYK